MKTPDPETIRVSAIARLRQLDAQEEVELLSRSVLEIGPARDASVVQRALLGDRELLAVTLRCRADDLAKPGETNSNRMTVYDAIHKIRQAIETVLPVEFKVFRMSLQPLLVDRKEFEKTDLERLIEAQIDLMIAVATGGPRIQTKNDEYRERRELIRAKIKDLGKQDPNPFEDLWAWYGRWSSGDLPSYQSRRDYLRRLYRPLLEDIVSGASQNPSEPSREPTGWEKVDRTVEKIVSNLGKANREEEFQMVGFLCRECLISLAQAVFDAEKHRPEDGVKPSETDAYRMLEAYFSAEFAGSSNEVLRRHAKASLQLANELQHKRTARYKDAALCAEATRTVVNIVRITSEKRQ
ncbi:MAG: hypothetical protein NT105_21980 [Verrucomicrobia bacterium]|nr:hypothetical protein [Verrucomicrobiota bacterium]